MAALIPRILTGPITLVMATIVLQLAAAWVLAGVASGRRGAVLLALGAIAASIAMNLFRFFLWRIIHQRYPLSHSYPLTALFFPCILALSWLRGDPVSLPQVAGTLLITVGALALAPSQGGSKT
jgi:hypothetical protein